MGAVDLLSLAMLIVDAKAMIVKKIKCKFKLNITFLINETFIIINHISFDCISKLGFVCEVVRMNAQNVSQFVLQIIIYSKIT